MAHDCRRTELFQGELLAALKILQRGDLTRETMIGAYAGELGQTQFLPSSYLKYGVDYDGNGHVDLRRSVPDVLASTANLLKVNGWKTGQPFGEGTGEFPGDARVEQERAVPQGDALFSGAAGGEVRGLSGAWSKGSEGGPPVGGGPCFETPLRVLLSMRPREE